MIGARAFTGKQLTRRQCLEGIAVPTVCSAAGVLAAACRPAPAAPAGSDAPLLKLSGKSVILDLWMIQLSAQADARFRQEVLDTFNAQAPKIQAQLTYTTWNELQEKVTVAMAGGVPPDVFQSAPQWTPLFIGPVGNETLLALDPYLATWDARSDFYDNMLRSCALRNRIWGLPYGADTRAILYRKSAFAESGLDPEQPPTNWQDLVTMALRTVKRAGPDFERVGFNVPLTQFATGQQWVNFFYQQGGDYFTEDFSRVLWNTEAGYLAAQFQADLVNKYQVCPLGGGGNLVRGTLAISDGNSGVVLDARRNAPEVLLDLGFGMPLKEKRQMAFLGGNSLHITKQSKGAAESWILLRWLLTPGPLTVYGEITSTPTGRISVNRDAQYMRDTPLLQRFAEAGQYGRTVPTVPGGGQLSTILHTALESIIRGQVAPKAGLDAAADQANRILEDARRSR